MSESLPEMPIGFNTPWGSVAGAVTRGGQKYYRMEKNTSTKFYLGAVPVGQDRTDDEAVLPAWMVEDAWAAFLEAQRKELGRDDDE